MVNPEGKNQKPKIYDPEIQEQIKTGEQLIEEGKNLIEEGYALIKQRVESLDAETDYLEYITMRHDARELESELEEEIMGTKTPPKYSVEDIEKSKREIEAIKIEIDKLQSDIDEMTLDNIHLDVINDEWKQLQEKFNQIILRVDKAQLN